MLDIGFWEIAIVLVLALIVLGPEQLPRVARSLGRTVGAIRRLAAEFQYTLEESAREETEAKRNRDAEEKAGKAAAGAIGSVPAEARTDPDAEPVEERDEFPGKSGPNGGA